MRESWETMGTIALYCFLIANIYFPAAVIYRHFLPNSPQAKWLMHQLQNIQILFNVLGLLAGFVHGHYADERNKILQAGFVMILLMTLNGVLMFTRFFSKESHHLKLRRLQGYLFVTCIGFLILGHSLL